MSPSIFSMYISQVIYEGVTLFIKKTRVPQLISVEKLHGGNDSSSMQRGRLATNSGPKVRAPNDLFT